jgi:hypothetical protein
MILWNGPMILWSGPMILWSGPMILYGDRPLARRLPADMTDWRAPQRITAPRTAPTCH